MIKHLLSGALLLALAACGGAKSNNATGNAQGNTANAAAANTAAPAANDAAATGKGHNEDGPRVLLTGEGVMGDGSDASLVRFGAPAAEAIQAVTKTLGGEFLSNGVEDCGGSGAANTANWGALVLYFQNSKFIGWEQRQASERPYIGTPGGVNVGSRRPDLAAALGGAPNVEQSSLGTEFDRGGVSGLLASDRPDAQVERLWAGNNCAMR